MTIEFGDVVFTLKDLKVAPWLSTGTYAPTSVTLGYASELSFSFSADNDSLKAFGMVAELLSVITSCEGKIKNAAIDSAAFWVITGHVTTSSGTTPNRTGTIDMIAGGAGLPYFGAVGSFAGLNGSGVLVGIRKVKLDNPPAWTVEQNKFRLAETGFKAAVTDTAVGSLIRIRKYETAASIPADLNTFFA